MSTSTAWVNGYSLIHQVRAAQGSQSDELRQLKAEPRRVTEERDVLKWPQRTLPCIDPVKIYPSVIYERKRF